MKCQFLLSAALLFQAATMQAAVSLTQTAGWDLGAGRLIIEDGRKKFISNHR